MAKIALYTNEDVTDELAKTLRTRGFDAVSVYEVGMRECSDEEQLAYAVSQKRAILTFNIEDYVELAEQYAASGREHYGIILSTQISFSQLLHRALKLLNTRSAEEMYNIVDWLNNYR